MLDEVPIPVIGKNGNCDRRIDPDGVMSSLMRGAEPTNRVRRIHDADFFRPQIVFGHVGKPSESADPARISNPPAGFFKHLAVQCCNGRFACINAPARQLEFWLRVVLVGKQQVSTKRQNRIDPGAQNVALPGFARVSESAHLTPLVAAGIATRYANFTSDRKA